MSKKKTTQTKSARAPKHVVPTPLQVVARLLDSGFDVDAPYLPKILTAADAAAARIVSDPVAQLGPEGASAPLEALADRLGAEDEVARILAVIPDSVHDPRSLITAHGVACSEAGLYLGLCLGYRFAAMFGGADSR